MKKDEEKQEYLLPIKSAKITGCLDGPLAIIEVEMTYVNEDTKSPIECSYEFPIDSNTVVSKLSA